MFDAAIEVGIATFIAHRGTADNGIRAALEQAGVAAWLAQRLVLYLPVAFGRRLLHGASFSDEIVDANERRRLGDDPVYAAAVDRAQWATREETEAIALRSAEVNAADQALRAGSKLEDLQFSPVQTIDPLLPAGADNGGVPSPRAAFLDFVTGHGFSVLPPLQLDAQVFPRLERGQIGVQVDFTVSHPALAVDRLVESFAGRDATWREAILQTIAKFERSSLHPLIAGLIDRTSWADQVSWERLEHPGGGFSVCLGGQLVLYAAEPVPDLGPLIDAMKRALGEVPLSRAVHGLRIYMCWNGAEMISSEVLLDNETWAAGVELARAYDWPRADGLWGSRLFLLLVPDHRREAR